MTNNLHKGEAMTAGGSQKNNAQSEKRYAFSATLKANHELEIKASYLLEVITTDLNTDIDDIYNIQQVQDVFKCYGVTIEMVKIVTYQIWHTMAAGTNKIECKSLRIYIDVGIDIFKDYFETRVYYIDDSGNMVCGNIHHKGPSEYVKPLLGQNLYVIIYCDRLDKKYELSELVSLADLKGEILGFERIQGNPNRMPGTPYKPDLYKYKIHMKR